MKRIINYLIIAVSIICLASCSSEQALREKVQKALDEQDFTTAYKIIDEARNSGNDDKKHASFDLNEMALMQEITDLIETDENGNNVPRMLYIIENRARYNDSYYYNSDESKINTAIGVYTEAIRIAESMNNPQLTESLNNAKNQLDGTELQRSVQNDLDKQDFASAYIKIDEARKSTNRKIWYASQKLNEEVLKKEINSLIEADRNGNNAPQIVRAISERAQYNSIANMKPKDSYNHAINLSESRNKIQLTKKLKSALARLETKK